jgi:hypothetical protein
VAEQQPFGEKEMSEKIEVDVAGAMMAVPEKISMLAMFGKVLSIDSVLAAPQKIEGLIELVKQANAQAFYANNELHAVKKQVEQLEREKSAIQEKYSSSASANAILRAKLRKYEEQEEAIDCSKEQNIFDSKTDSAPEGSVIQQMAIDSAAANCCKELAKEVEDCATVAPSHIPRAMLSFAHKANRISSLLYKLQQLQATPARELYEKDVKGR